MNSNWVDEENLKQDSNLSWRSCRVRSKNYACEDVLITAAELKLYLVCAPLLPMLLPLSGFRCWCKVNDDGISAYPSLRYCSMCSI